MEDTPYHRKTVNEMSQQELTQWLDQIRIRRLKEQARLKEAEETKALLKDQRDLKEYDQHMKMLEKEWTTYERAALKLETRLSKVLTLKLIAERTTSTSSSSSITQQGVSDEEDTEDDSADTDVATDLV